jgi:hypothetical protein
MKTCCDLTQSLKTDDEGSQVIQTTHSQLYLNSTLTSIDLVLIGRRKRSRGSSGQMARDLSSERSGKLTEDIER